MKRPDYEQEHAEHRASLAELLRLRESVERDIAHVMRQMHKMLAEKAAFEGHRPRDV